MAKFSGKGSMANRDVIVTFPVSGIMRNKDHSIKGYYADVELNQTNYDQKGGTVPQTNPHLVTSKVADKKNGGYLKDRNGHDFLNHRVFYDLKQVQKIMNAGKDSKIYTTRDANKRGKAAFSEFDQNDLADGNNQKMVADNLANVRVGVNASLMSVATKNSGMRVIINTGKDIKPSQTPFGKGSMEKQAASMHQAKLNEAQMAKEDAEKTAPSGEKVETNNLAQDPVFAGTNSDKPEKTDTPKVESAKEKQNDPVADLPEVKGGTDKAADLSDDKAPF